MTGKFHRTQILLEPGQHLALAEQLGQAKSYDAEYIALAEKLRAPLWTAEQRLVNKARQIGSSWIHLVGGE